MLTTAIVNPKGGVGKSTSCANFAAIAARLGLKTLLLDLDPQRTASANCGIDFDIDDLQTASALFCDMPAAPSDLVIPTAFGFDIITAGAALTQADNWIGQTSLGEMRLYLSMSNDTRLRAYDMIVIDTPGYRNKLLTSAIIAAGDVLIPINASVASTDQLPDLMEVIDTVSEVREGMQQNAVHIRGLYFNAVKARTRASVANIDEVAAALGDYPVADTIIPHSTAVEDSLLRRKPLVLDQPNSRPALAYCELFSELVSQKVEVTA